MHGDATFEPGPTLDTPTLAVASPDLSGTAVDEPAGLRCAICHDGLEPRAARRCPGCRTLTHAECLAELGRSRCATLGCGGRRQSPIVRSLAPLEAGSRWLLAPALLTLAGSGVVALVAGVIAAIANRGHRVEPVSIVVALACAVAHALVVPGAWLSSLRGRGLVDGLRAVATVAAVTLPLLGLLFVVGRGDVRAFAAVAALLEPLLATLILGLVAGGESRGAVTPAPRVLVRARPLALAGA